MKKLVYKQWRIERGDAIEVSLIEFIDYFKDRNTIVRFSDKGTDYIGEVWLAERNGSRHEVIFRVEDYLPVENEESSIKPLSLSPECIDHWVNPIVDEPEIIDLHLSNKGYIKRESVMNRGLQKFSLDQDNYIIKFIEFINSLDKSKLLYKIAEKKLKFLTSPDLYNARLWKKVPNEHKIMLDKHFKTKKYD